MPTSTTTPGQILLRELVPSDMKEFLDRPLDKKGSTLFFDALARRHPEEYVDVMHKMTSLANQVSTEYGRWTSLSLSDLDLPPRTKAFREMLRQRVDLISQNPAFTPEQKSEKIVSLIRANIEKAKTMLEDEGVEKNNAFALSSRHGFRGNQTQLMQMLFGDMLVADNNDKPIPFPVLHSYAEGLSPLETWAGSYGSRKGYCLKESELVRMADGSSKAIQRIRAGDMVMGCDGDGTPVPVKVLELINQGEKLCFHFYFQCPQGQGVVSFASTLDHRVVEYTNEGYKLTQIGNMDNSKRLFVHKDYKGSATFIGAIMIGAHPTFDLSVDHPSHLFFLANGICVSNSAVQFSTADTGYYAKQLAHMNTGIQVLEEDCGSKSGITMDPHSDDAAGRFVASSYGPVKEGSVLTPDSMRKIRQKQVQVRSPITCLLPHGVCQKCVGLRPDGKLPGLNSFVSLEASRVVTEPMTQKLALCLSPDTFVRMGNGSVKQLDLVKPGDVVLGANRCGRTFPVTVAAVHKSRADLYRMHVVDGDGVEDGTLDCSLNHKLLTARYEGEDLTESNPADLKTALCRRGPRVRVKRQGSKYEVTTAYSLSEPSLIGYSEDTLDLEVNHPDHLFVLGNGLIVSNSAKHLGGQVGVNDKDAEGFEEIDQFVQVPETFKGSILSGVDGTVTKVETAPQGGKYVYVDSERYHVPEGREVTVRPGKTVQAGDQLTDGTMNPAEVANYRGIGEGRRYFVEKFGEILKRNGVGALRQNLELLARSYIQNVRVTDPDGVAGYRFGEVLPYEAMQAHYVPRSGAKLQKLKYTRNQYLEQPLAHYTIGTRITDAVISDIQKQGIGEVLAHTEAPGFQPHITRAASRSTEDQDWKARLGGFYLKDSYRDMATLGAVDEPEGRPSTFAAIMDPSRLKDIK
jgi:hypothetical protein